MYLTNKYTTYYFNIINKARARIKTIGYAEKHHIIPKSLGGDNSKSNLVLLTAKEHYICHLLLPKMLTGDNMRKMSYAIWLMINVNRGCQLRYKVTSRMYKSIKEKNSKLLSIANKGKLGIHSGKKFSNETKQKMSLSAVGRKPSLQAIEAAKKSRKGIPPSNKGKPMSQAQKDKIRLTILTKNLAKKIVD